MKTRVWDRFGTYSRVLALFFLAANATFGQSWYNTSWNYRKAITINSSEVAGSSSLTNFPVLISLSSDSYLASGAQSSGNDILFTDSTGTTKINHQIETYVSSSGQLIAWVQVPSVSPTANTVIYMYYGNASATNQQNSTAVWDSNYTGVWHFPSGSSLSLTDSTSNGNNGTNSGAAASTGQSQLGGDLSASSGYASVSGFTGLSNTPTFTVETWAYFAPDFYNGLLGDGTSGQVPVHFGLTQFAGTDQVQVYYKFTSTNNWNWASTGTLTANTWNHIVVTCDTSSQCILYLNGAQDSTSTLSLGGNTPSASSPFSLGTVPGYGYVWGGGIDEVRTSKTVRSGGWITTEYNNQNSPSGFYSVGLQQTDSPVATPTISPAAGSYATAQPVTISTTTSGAVIVYTTDGSTPSHSNGTTYNGAFTVNSNETVKAFAYESGWVDSGVASAAYTVTGGTNWYNTSWNYRKAITINSSEVAGSSSLTNFPVLISLSSDSYLASGAQSSGNDILFTDSTGTTKINHQIETYVSSSGQLIAWVQVPSVSPTANTVIYMYYGNASATNQQNSTAVWDSNYTGVWHFPSGSSLSLTDSTSNGNNGTNSGAAASTGQSQLGGDLSASSGYASVSGFTGLSNTPTFTVETWAYFAPDFYNGLLGDGTSGQVPVHFGLTQFAGTDQLSVFYGFTSTNNWNWASTGTLTANTWNHIVVTCNTSSQCVLYLNGVQDSTSTVNLGGNTPSASSPFAVGTVPGYGYVWGAGVDEVRTSKTVRSAGWITTEYNNQHSPSGFYSVGSQQTSTVTITITSAPAGLTVTVDSGTCAATPCSYQWTPGQSHTIAAATQAGGSGVQYAFVNWTGGAGSPDQVTAPSSATTYTATFATQYYLTTSVSPSGSGTITPSSEWVTSGTPVPIAATDNSTSHFTGFTGGTLSGSNTPQTIATMTGPAMVVANFTALSGSSGPPTAVSVSPSSGSGTSQTFTYVASSPNGSAYLSTVYMLVGWPGWGPGSCWVTYNQASNLLYLADDLGNFTTTPGVAPGTIATLTNSQCQLNTGGATVSGSGNNLTIAIPLTFLPGYLGPLSNEMFVTDVNNANNGYYLGLGSWTAYSASPSVATINSVLPSSGSGLSQTFTYSISDVNGNGYVERVDMLFSSSYAFANSCLLSLYTTINEIWLETNAGAFGVWAGNGVLGSTSPPISNSQCELNVSAASMVRNGNNLTVTLPLTFTSSFTGTQNEYVGVVDRANNFSNVGPYGTWIPQSTSAITVTSSPVGRSLSVDGTTCTAPCSFQWPVNSTHTINVATNPQSGASGTQYLFLNWSDNQAQSHSITVPSSATTYTANFTTQYYLTTSASPSNEGSISPLSGYQNSGAQVPVSATPGSGYQFSGFSGALSGTNPNQTLTMNAPGSVVANFMAPGCGFTITPPFYTTTAFTPGVGISGISLQTYFTLSGVVGTALTWLATTPPPGIFISTSGFISGTVPSTAGTYPIPITASSSTCPGGTNVTLNFVVHGSTSGTLTITPASLPTASIGHPYSQAFGATGGSGSYSFSISGEPSWLTVSGNTISGTPTSAGNSTLQVTVTDTVNQTQQPGTFTLTVLAGTITITPSSVPGGEVNVSYQQPGGGAVALTASGGNGSYSWSVPSGALPPGLSLSSTTGTSISITGTPSTATGSPFSFTISVTDTNSALGTRSFTVGVLAGPSIATPTSPLQPAVFNQTYSVTFVATGGTGVYSSWTATNLPTGLSINSVSGQLSGTPTQSGTFNNIVVTVTDSAGATKSVTYSLQVLTTPPPLSVSCSGSPNPVAVGETVTFLAGPFGGTPPYSYSWAGTGISGTSISTTMSPTLSQVGTLTATITVTDSATPTHATAPSSCSVTVTSAPTSTIKEFIRIGGRIIAVENH